MVNQLSAKELAKKNKPYQKKKSRTRRNAILIIVVLAYVFFYSSNIILPKQVTGGEDVTKAGVAVDFAENRSVTLVSAIYSPDQEQMEVVLNFKNENYDNINDYYYALDLLGCKTKGITIREVFNEDLFTVVRVENLPKRYAEMTLYFAPKTVKQGEVTDAITGQITMNKHNVKEGRIDLTKDKLTYLAERLDSVIASYVAVLAEQQRQLKEYQETITALEIENQKVARNSPYMTEIELEEKEAAVLQNEESLVEMRENVKTQQAKISYTKRQIDIASQKRNQLE